MKAESECGVGRKAEPLQKPEKFLQRLRRQESASFGNQNLMVSAYEGPRRRCNSGAFLGRHSTVTSSGVSGCLNQYRQTRKGLLIPVCRQHGQSPETGFEFSRLQARREGSTPGRAGSGLLVAGTGWSGGSMGLESTPLVKSLRTAVVQQAVVNCSVSF